MGQPAEDDALDAAIGREVEALAAAFDLPGGAVALVRGDSTVLRAFGQACLPFAVPATPDTLFHTASVGKHATAIALLRLLARQGLTPAEPVGRFLDDIPNGWRDRSVASLLRHTSGIPDYGHPPFDLTRPHSRAEILAAAAERPPLFPEGEGWAYSNTNYMLAGYVIEALSGTDFATALRAEALEPAGLPTARTDDAGSPIPGRAEPYVRRDGALRHAPRMDGAYSGYADGPLLMSARDAALWLRALLDGRLLGADAAGWFTAPAPLAGGLAAPYGCGVFLDTLRGRALLSHTGGLPGFTAFFAWLPEIGVGVAVLTNISLSDSRTQRFIGHRCLEVAVPGVTALSLPDAADDRPDWTAEMARLVLRGAEPVPPDRLAPNLRRVMAAGAGDKLFTNRAQCPPLRSVTLVESRDHPGGTMRRYRLRHDDLTEHLSVGYDGEGRIFWVFPD